MGMFRFINISVNSSVLSDFYNYPILYYGDIYSLTYFCWQQCIEWRCRGWRHRSQSHCL